MERLAWQSFQRLVLQEEVWQYQEASSRTAAATSAATNTASAQNQEPASAASKRNLTHKPPFSVASKPKALPV